LRITTSFGDVAFADRWTAHGHGSDRRASARHDGARVTDSPVTRRVAANVVDTVTVGAGTIRVAEFSESELQCTYICGAVLPAGACCVARAVAGANAPRVHRVWAELGLRGRTRGRAARAVGSERGGATRAARNAVLHARGFEYVGGTRITR